VGDPLKPADGPVDGDRLRQATGAREHRVFAGRIDRSLLGFGERAIVGAMRIGDRDDRSRSEVEAWAATIASAIVAYGPAPVLPR
jgi:menaquinone-dependent protoporphyrinogen oxidase